MKLKNQLLALSALTLLLPWSGWKLLHELENFLREGEETALLVSAHSIAQALPGEYQSALKLARGQILPVRQFASPPILDGYGTDWPETRQNLEFEAPGGVLALQVLAGRFGEQVYLLLNVTDPDDINATDFNTGTSRPAQKAGVMLYLQTNRSQEAFMISTEAPGPLTVKSEAGTATRLAAAWMDNAAGYTLEISLPAGVERISVGAVAPVSTLPGVSAERYAGTLNGRQQGQWLELAWRDNGVAQWLTKVVPDHTRAWLLQADGWVIADSGEVSEATDSELSWAQRMLYQGVAGSGIERRGQRSEWPVRVQNAATTAAFEAGEGMQWSRDVDSAAVFSLVAVPVMAQDKVIGALVLEASSDGLLVMTNRALGRLLATTFLLVGVLSGGLWLFASRLSRRVRKLSGVVSSAMDASGETLQLPASRSSDELGDLARNTEKLLRAVAEYTRYLQKLAGRLSHELKTPIAITRSSLENLSSCDLDDKATQYLSRAREGLDRQAAIVSAMSAAQRLEESVKTAEWDTISLFGLLENCVAGYRSAYPGRDIRLARDADVCELYCAPDLLAQALDKLVDNAIGLSAPDGRIDIGAKSSADDCLLTVANSGTRLPDVLPEKLFDSLVSLREDRGSGQHLGLGLHIVRLVAGIHEGSVAAHNLPDAEGVEFIIRLPLTRSG